MTQLAKHAPPEQLASMRPNQEQNKQLALSWGSSIGKAGWFLQVYPCLDVALLTVEDTPTMPARVTSQENGLTGCILSEFRIVKLSLPPEAVSMT